MSEECPDDIVSLAEEYLDSLDDEDGTEADVDEVKEELKYWEEQVAEFEEGTTMYGMAVEERDTAREKLEIINSRGQHQDELRLELLTRASTEFAPQEKWVNPVVIEALSHSLIERRYQRVHLGEFVLPSDAEGMSKRDMVETAKTVHSLCRDAIGDADDRLPAVWEGLNTETRRAIIRVLAGHLEPISSSQISDELGEDGPSDPGANIRMLRDDFEIEPFYSSKQGYALTIVGRYVWEEYGPDEPANRGADAVDDQVESDSDEDAVDESMANGESSETTSKEVDLSSFEVRE